MKASGETSRLTPPTVRTKPGIWSSGGRSFRTGKVFTNPNGTRPRTSMATSMAGSALASPRSK
jgi:hypothetical protein